MTTEKIEGSIYKRTYGGVGFIQLSEEDIKKNPEYGYLFIQAHTIEVEIDPAFDERKAKIAALQAAAEKLNNDFNAKVQKINTEISKLQAIGYESGQHSESVADIVGTFDDEIPF